MNTRAPDTIAPALAWADRAACRGQDTDIFYTDSKHGIAYAKTFCNRCPVRRLCLNEALRAEDTSRYGVFGGLTPTERGEVAKGLRQ
jgi:WhiB family redox-sensing transcriptional regulator